MTALVEWTERDRRHELLLAGVVDVLDGVEPVGQVALHAHVDAVQEAGEQQQGDRAPGRLPKVDRVS